MKKALFGLGFLGIVIAGFIIAVLMAVIMIIIAFQLDDVEEDYYWGGDGNFADNEVPLQYIPLYQDAAGEYGLEWELLAAVHRVETIFSTLNPMISYVGAEGHAQFMPCTWVGWAHSTCEGLGEGNIPDSDKSNPDIIETYGGYGMDANGDGKADMWDLEDAIYGMSNYLSVGYESTGTIEGAIRMYNHSTEYVTNVLYFMNNYQTDLVAKDHTGGQSPVELVGNKAWVVPAANYISSCFGPRWGRQHNGIDVTAGEQGKIRGYDIVALMDGTISVSQYNSDGYGHMVMIDHGGGLQTLYGHMIDPGLPVGMNVKAGDRIGRVGTSGNSTGYHLHLEIRNNGTVVNPLPILADFDLVINPNGSSCPLSL